MLDNLSTGSYHSIEEHNLFIHVLNLYADIRDYESCLAACEGIDRITHQAALGSVPRSINDPLTTNAVNITGTLNIYTAAKEKKLTGLCMRPVHLW